MRTKQETCGTCGGSGYTVVWKIISTDEKTGIGTMQSEQIMCEACGGKGYVEYVTFTVEEAKAILKHCGLSTES